MIPTLNFNKIYKHTENDKFKNKIQQFCIFLIKMKFYDKNEKYNQGRNTEPSQKHKYFFLNMTIF